jgi:hypothetical protein
MKSLLIIYFCIMGDPKCFSTDTFSEIHTNIDSCKQASEVVRRVREGDAKLFGEYPILIIKYKCSEGV